MGKKDGSHDDDALVLAAGAEKLVEVEGADSSSVSEGLALMGRSGWSVGFAMMDVGAGTGARVWIVPTMVVVEEMIWSWLSSSCSDGMGRSVCLEASIDSPRV